MSAYVLLTHHKIAIARSCANYDQLACDLELGGLGLGHAQAAKRPPARGVSHAKITHNGRTQPTPMRMQPFFDKRAIPHAFIVDTPFAVITAFDRNVRFGRSG